MAPPAPPAPQTSTKPRLSILLLTIISTKYHWAHLVPCPCLRFFGSLAWLFCAPLRLFDKSAKSCTKNTPNTTSKLSLRSIAIGALTVQAVRAVLVLRDNFQTHNCNCSGQAKSRQAQPSQVSSSLGHTNFFAAHARSPSRSPARCCPRSRPRPHHNVNVNAF